MIKEIKEYKNPEVIILVGVQGSGKSEFARKMIEENLNYVRVSRDGFRAMLTNFGPQFDNLEMIINQMEKQTILHALKHKLNVIVDDTNIKQSVIKEIVSWVTHLADVRFEIFDVPLAVCLERNKLRNDREFVDETHIRSFYDKFQVMKKQYKFEPIPRNPYKEDRFTLVQDETLPKAVVSDIDGTLAIAVDRFIFNENKVDTDIVNEPVANMVRNYPGVKILVSGRKETCREMTEKWLKDNNIPFDFLYMRGEFDIRKDKKVKADIFNNFIRDKYYVDYVLDDRDQTVLGFRELGLLCLQVYYGDF